MIDIRHGDCLELLPTLEAGSVESVCMDPPYFLPATHYQVRSGTHRSLADLCILEHYFADVFAAIRRVLKPDGFVYVFCDGQSYPVFYATAYRHFKRLRPLVWDKATSFTGYAWRHQHELILFCESEESPAIKTGDGDVLRLRAVPIDDRDHLAQKPVELVRRLISKVTPPGGTVLDPFLGSGTTAVACIAEGRNCIGIERDEGYVTIARKRVAEALTKEREQTPLFAAEEHQ